jgi:nucleotide-binding universal stress UspA family protein
MIFQRILIAVDRSLIASHAAGLGVELARKHGSEVAFVHVVNRLLGFTADAGTDANVLLALAARDGKSLLADLRQRASLRPAPSEFIPIGKPAIEIIKIARDWQADLIVLGSHGRIRIPRLLLGSVAEKVMRRAPCPVLVVPANT